MLNATDTTYEERPAGGRRAASALVHAASGSCRSARAGISGSDAGGLVDALIGGWSFQAIGQIQSGLPIDFGNLYYNGDPTNLKAKYSSNTDVPVFDISGFYFHDAAVQTNGVDDPVKQRNDQRIHLANNVRYFPSRIEGDPQSDAEEWDLSFVKQVPDQRQRPRPVQPRVAERVQPDVFQQRQHRPDERQLRQGDDAEQPAARHPARVQDRLLIGASRKGRGQPAPSLSFLSPFSLSPSSDRGIVLPLT